MKYPPNYYPHIQQHSPEWLQIRNGCLTASRIADVVLKKKDGKYYASRDDYMADLLAEVLTGRASEHYVSVPMMFGIENEPLAVANYEFAMNVECEKIGYISHPTIKRAGASPDRLVGDEGMLETKVPNTKTHLKYLEAGVIPEEYLPQCMWQLACAPDRKWVQFVSYDPRLNEDFGLFVAPRLYRDDEKIAEMEAEALKFIAEMGERAQRLLKRKGEHRAAITSLPDDAEDSGIPASEIPNADEWIGNRA